MHLVLFLTAARILTARTHRDHFYTGVLAFLQLLAAALVSNHPSFFVFLGLFLLFAIAAFTSAEIHRAMGQPWRVARSGLRRFQWRLTALAVIISVGILSLTMVHLGGVRVVVVGRRIFRYRVGGPALVPRPPAAVRIHPPLQQPPVDERPPGWIRSRRDHPVRHVQNLPASVHPRHRARIHPAAVLVLDGPPLGSSTRATSP